jgi:hypothetical protein
MLRKRGERARATPCTDSLNMMTMSNMSNSLVGRLGRDRLHQYLRHVPISFIDEDHYLIELDPQHINDRGRVKMTYQAILQMAKLKV